MLYEIDLKHLIERITTIDELKEFLSKWKHFKVIGNREEILLEDIVSDRLAVFIEKNKKRLADWETFHNSRTLSNLGRSSRIIQIIVRYYNYEIKKQNYPRLEESLVSDIRNIFYTHSSVNHINVYTNSMLSFDLSPELILLP